MSFTQPGQLIGAGLVGLVVAYLLARLAYGDLPTLPVFSGATLLLVALVELVLALVLRPRVLRKPGTEPVESLTAARAVALAKASSLAGAIMAGCWLGLLGYLVPMLEVVHAAQQDTLTAIIGAISAGALIAAGLWLEYVLQNPDEPEEPDELEE
jgi:hypothetical protein